MNFKKLIIIFLILVLIPIIFGKVTFPPFSDFYQSWDMFKITSKKLLADDYNYYKNLTISWAEKAIDAIGEKIKSMLDGKIGDML